MTETHCIRPRTQGDLFSTAPAVGWDLHGGPSSHFPFPFFGIWTAVKIGIEYTQFQEERCRRAVTVWKCNVASLRCELEPL